MRIKLVVAALAPLVGMAGVAVAQEGNVAAREIGTGAYTKAERILVAEMRQSPRPEVLLNLAAVYYGTGRVDQARALYLQVLAQPDVEMDLSTSGSATSHAVARAGLGYLDARQRTALR